MSRVQNTHNTKSINTLAHLLKERYTVKVIMPEIGKYDSQIKLMSAII